MRLDLERDLPIRVEVHDAGVIHERRTHPGAGEFVGSRADRGTQEAVYRLADPVGACEPDAAFEGLVLAVLGPGLRECLELHIGRVAPQRAELVPDRAHLGEREEQHPLRADAHHGDIVGLAQRYDLGHVGGRCGGQEGWRQRAQREGLHHLVAQDLARDALEIGRS